MTSSIPDASLWKHKLLPGSRLPSMTCPRSMHIIISFRKQLGGALEQA